MLVVIIIARFVILEASARYVLVTGETLLAGYGRVGRWVVWVIFLAPLFKGHVSGLYQVLLIGSAVHLLVPLPTRHSTAIWALLFWGLGFALMYWGRYRMVERLSRPLLVILGGPLVTVALLSKPDPAAILQGLLIPSIPEQQGMYSFALLLMALVGAGSGSLSNLKYAAFVHEKGWRDLSFLRPQRVDLLLSVAGMFAISALIQIAAAATLRPSGFQLEGAEDLVPMFSQALGNAGRIILGIGLWAAVFTTYVGSSTGYALMLSDIYHRFIRPPKDAGGSEAIAGGHDHLPAYRWCVVWFCVSPLYVLLTDWTPIWITLLSASLAVILLPVTVSVLLRLTSDRKLMGAHVNGWATNTVMVSVILATIYLTYQNAIEFWADLTTAF